MHTSTSNEAGISAGKKVVLLLTQDLGATLTTGRIKLAERSGD